MNTGKKIYQFLKQVNSLTGLPTGIIKPNVIGDPDYIPPVVDYIKCPINSWVPIDEFCLTTKTCAPGWILNSDKTSCVQVETQAATPPSGNGGTPGTVIKINNIQWNNGGALLFDTGYAVDGVGTYTNLTTPHFWVNGNTTFDPSSRNLIDSRMNVAGIWGSPAAPDGEWIGFSRKITTTEAKIVYIGMSADNAFKFTVNANILVSTDNILGGPNFNYWNIYPVQLKKGDNYIEMYCENFAGDAGFAAEIYDNTAAELIAATQESDLNIVFSTRNIVGQLFDLGETLGWSCPVGWSLDNNGSIYFCVRENSTAPTIVNTGLKGFNNRMRLHNGVADGYVEPNLENEGIGIYFPPVVDPVSCP